MTLIWSQDRPSLLCQLLTTFKVDTFFKICEIKYSQNVVELQNQITLNGISFLFLDSTRDVTVGFLMCYEFDAKLQLGQSDVDGLFDKLFEMNIEERSKTLQKLSRMCNITKILKTYILSG